MKYILLLFIMFAPMHLMAFETNYETTLKHVTSIGQWNHNNQKGYFRFITHATGSEHVISKLYVQWLTHQEDGVTQSEIIAEKEIIELRGYEFSTPTCNTKNNCSSFILTATESFGHFKSYIFNINVSKIGEYTLVKQSL